MFCPLKAMRDLAELWVARTRTSELVKPVPSGLTCVTASLVSTQCDAQRLSLPLCLSSISHWKFAGHLANPPCGQAHHCPRIAYSNGSVFSVDSNGVLPAYFPGPLSSVGCWKAAGVHAGVRTLSCGEGCFCPCGTEQENLKYRSQGSSCCSLWPGSPVQKVNAEEFQGPGVSIIFKICYYQVLFSSWTDLRLHRTPKASFIL